jgi:hypothetical protein
MSLWHVWLSETAHRQDSRDEQQQSRRLWGGGIRTDTRSGMVAEVGSPDDVIAGVGHTVAISIGANVYRVAE